MAAKKSDLSAAQFLAGGGEMGERTRRMDWSSAPVGPIAEWPQSLKTAVSICLGSRHPIVVWWGRSAHTQFYNDAYISFLGCNKHPLWLGRSGRDCWSEIWPVIGPMLDSVYTTGEATWSEDLLLTLQRNLPREEGYFTFSYSPICDDAGAIGGIFCACNETTARVIGERRLQTLRHLGRMEAEAKTAEAACEVAARTLVENPGDIPFASCPADRHNKVGGRRRGHSRPDRPEKYVGGHAELAAGAGAGNGYGATGPGCFGDVRAASRRVVARISRSRSNPADCRPGPN